jgi:hypothetical protein
VDVDGLGSCAVAQEESGRCSIVSPAASREKCERLVAKLRERDAARLAASRRLAGQRLARHRTLNT